MNEKYDNGETIGSIKSSLNFYMERMSENYSPKRKNLKDETVVLLKASVSFVFA